MARSEEQIQVAPPREVMSPQIQLQGQVCDETLTSFKEQLAAAERNEGPIAVELMTMGGDAEMGRRLALEVRLARERLGRRLLFVGKTAVFSAGATMMGGFPNTDRYLSRDAVLLFHCRQLEKSLQLQGPLKSSRIQVGQLLEEIENGIRIEREGFEAVVAGSDVSLDEILAKAETSWYVPAAEALERRLVAGLI